MKILPKNAGTKEFLFFIILFLLSIATTYKVHQGRGILNWQSEIWADRAGYYIYLPATFFYHFDVSRSPEKIDERTGYGFEIDHANNKIYTQYFYGVSFLISPFFVAGHVLSKITGKDEIGGFSWIYNKIVNVAAVFYLVLGLFFLRRFLKNYFSEAMQYLLILLTFLGTNLFFYTIEDTLMSHVYSFFAVSLFLFAMKKFLTDPSGYRYFILMSFAFGFMFIIRPTNCLIGLLFPFWDTGSRKEMTGRLKLIFQPKHILVLLAIMFILFIPQMIYWKITHGSFIYLKYGAGFANWSHPKFLEVWFATLNGLVPWSPLIILFMAGMVFMIVRRIPNGILIFVFFILISYMAAAYKYWYFGCGYGHRAFVEFYPVFCIPFGFLIVRIFNAKRGRVKFCFGFLVFFLTGFNVALSLTADKCYFGSTWDWDQYARQVSRIHLYPKSLWPYSFKNDFENGALANGTWVTDTIQNSGLWSAVMDPRHEYCCEHSAMIWDFNGNYPKFIRVKLLTKKVNAAPVNAYIVCSIERHDTTLNYQSCPLDEFVKNTLSWFIVVKTFPVPEGLPGDAKIKVYVWNKEKTTLFVDDLDIQYEW